MDYSSDNPFAKPKYSKDNPFAAPDFSEIEKLDRDLSNGSAYGRAALKSIYDSENATEAAAAKPSVAERVTAHALNVGRGLPGGEALESAAGAAGSHIFPQEGQKPLSYSESRKTLKENTDNINGPVSFAEKLGGSLLSMPLMPASPFAGGAAFGAADALLDSDPQNNVGDRLKNAAIMGTAGGIGGKVAGNIATSLRAAGAGSMAGNVIDKQLTRADEAMVNYSRAMAQGNRNGATSHVMGFLKQPDIADIVSELRSTRPFQNVSADSPEMLDAVYKTLSDRAGQLKKGLDVVSPNRPNIGRFRLQDTRQAQGDLLGAVEKPDINPFPTGGNSTVLPMMDTYRTAVEDYARRTANLAGQDRGYDAFRSAMGKNLPNAKNALRKSVEGFDQWAGKAPLNETSGAKEGVLSGLRDQIVNGGKPIRSILGRPATRAQKLLESVDSPRQRLINKGVRTAGASAVTQNVDPDFVALLGMMLGSGMVSRFLPSH